MTKTLYTVPDPENGGIKIFSVDSQGNCEELDSVIDPTIAGDIEMIPVEGGRFIKKGDKRLCDRIARENEFDVASFYISSTMITQGQWARYLDDIGQTHDYALDSKYPISNISWIDAAKYCNWLNVKHGLSPKYKFTDDETNVEFEDNCKGFQIPTVEDYCWVMQGGIQALDFLYPGDDDGLEVGWYSENSNNTLQEVGKKKPVTLPGGYNIYDLSGLLWKMTETLVDEN